MLEVKWFIGNKLALLEELDTVSARILGAYGIRIRPDVVRYKLAFIEESKMETTFSLVFYLVVTVIVVINVLRKRTSFKGSGSAPGSAQGSFTKNAQQFMGAEAGSYKRESSAMKDNKESGAMPHKHEAPDRHVTFNKKSGWNNIGSMAHRHEERHFTTMPDVTTLPKGYILLNGEPVRVADLENK